MLMFSLYPLPCIKACEHKATFEVVLQLIRIYPDSLNEKNYGGDLPIHIACREGSSKDIIHIMLQKSVQTIQIPDCEGRLPLHLAACSETIHVNSIQDLISYNEKATRTPDDFGLLPLHWACTKNAPAINVETIIKAYPFAVEQKDVYEYLPIDRVMTSKNPQKAKIVELLSRDVSSWSSAMMSTIVDLSNKLAAAGMMEQGLKAKEGECKVLMQQSKRSYDEINALTIEIHKMQDLFVHKMRQMQRAHVLEIQQLEKQFEKHHLDSCKDKDIGKRKENDLKILVDELVEQLKIQKSLVDEKETSRKEMKIKAMTLVSRLEESKNKVNETSAENELLKLYEVKLKYEIEKRDQHIRNLSVRKGRAAEFEDANELDYTSRGPHDTGFMEDRQDQNNNDIPRTFECVRIEEENSY